MLETVKRWIDRQQLLLPGDTVVIACSGGPDSLALLHILAQLRQSYDLKLVVAHVNHMFRPEARDEAQFVKETAAKLGLAFESADIDVPAYIEESGLSAQEAARIARYRFLYAVAERWGGAKIATGHHRDDQAETILLHLLRGAGGSGLTGMKPVNRAIIRPLLAVERDEIESYCRQHGLTPVYDRSNSDTDYLRNKIRLELIPYLEKEYNASLRQSLCRTAQIIGDEHAYVAEMAQKSWPDIGAEKDGQVLLDTRGVASLAPALQREILRLAIEKKQGHVRGIKFLHVEKLIELALHGSPGTMLELPGGLRAVKSYHVLIVASAAEWCDSCTAVSEPISLPVPGYVNWNGWEITAQLMNTREGGDTACCIVLDWDRVAPPLVVRSRQEGDRFQPLGLGGSKKLKEFFIDSKVPRHLRDSIPLVCDQQGILWVAGCRQSERGKVTASTNRYLQLTLNKQEDQHA